MQRHEPRYAIRKVQPVEEDLRGRAKPLRDNEGQVVRLPLTLAEEFAKTKYGPLWRDYVDLTKD